MALSALDDPEALAAIDRSGMLEMVARTGSQLRRGFELGRSGEALPSAEGLGSIVVCGMGGSGVSGDVLRVLFANRLPVPILVEKGYDLPASCHDRALVFAVSFSGNTEETLSAYVEGVARSCRMVAVSAGGELAAFAAADGVPHVRLPDDVAMPRAALGYLAGALIGCLEAIGMIDASAEVDSAGRLLDELARSVAPGRPAEENEAKLIASWLGARTPLVWGSVGLAEAAALRWKCQLNENAKMPAFHDVLPELDHNDVEGWSARSGEAFAALVLRHAGEDPRIQARVDATLSAVAPSGLEARQVLARGTSPAERLFSLIMLGDFTSVYAALLRGIDPTPVPILTGLKARLRP
jgi:glucose/mannose-6-phosphate isomerase